MIPVVWLTFAEDGTARGHWHDEMLGDLFDRRVWRPVNALEYEHLDGNTIPGEMARGHRGAVVVISGTENAERIVDVNRYLIQLPWCLVIVAGDESHVFPRDQIDHPRCEVWAQCTRPGDEQRALGFGYPPGTREGLAEIGRRDRVVPWSFVGQINHARRDEMLRAVRSPSMPPGALRGTNHFAAHLDGSGMSRAAYLEQVAVSRVVLCPSGPQTVDSFRLYEALEAGAIPFADRRTPGFDDPDYWLRVFGEHPPFPVVGLWDSTPGYLEEMLPDATRIANRVSAWYQQRKRDLAYELDATVRRLAECGNGGNKITTDPTLADLISVVVTTSPAPLHPSTEHIEETIASIRAQLPDSEIIIAADGVRPEQADRAAAYDEYLARLLWLCNLQWSNVLPVLLPEWGHQANAARDALREVRTPLVLFVEHDTPLVAPTVGEIDWEGCASVIRSGQVNVIRFHHEASVLDVHQYLMLDAEPHGYRVGADAEAPRVPLLRTVQWSQRPHLGPTLWYRDVLDRYFAPASRTMIEDVLYGKVENAWRQHGVAGWEQWRVAMYAPPLPLKRSEHLDSRGDDPKYEMTPVAP